MTESDVSTVTGDGSGTGDVAAGQDTPVTVTVDGLAKAFGDVAVLSDVSFEARAGTVTCVVGPNGSGKTTLLRLVAGLLAPDGGHAQIDAAGERTVGYLSQLPAFRPQFTLAETVAFYGSLVSVDPEPTAVLDRVGLAAIADRRIAALSGGMTRLFGIAQATVGDPPVLVLDEPSSGLDPTMTDQVGSVVRDLADDGRTVLLATHDLETVDRVADTVLVLDAGEIQVADAPDALRGETGAPTLTQAVTAYVAGDTEALTVRTGVGGETDE
jgi:ABC-type multidrug transport system ATPase subunit